MDHHGSYSFRARLEPDEYLNLPFHLGIRKDALSKNDSWSCYRHFNLELWKKIQKILEHNVGKDYNNTISYILRKYARKQSDREFVLYALYCFCERSFNIWSNLPEYFRDEKGIMSLRPEKPFRKRRSRVKVKKSSTSEGKKEALLKRRAKNLHQGVDRNIFWDSVLKASKIIDRLNKEQVPFDYHTILNNLILQQ